MRHPFTDVVTAWLHHLNRRNQRQKKPAATKAGVCPALPAQVAAHACHCPRMEPKQLSTVRPSPSGWAGNKEEEESCLGCSGGRTGDLPRQGLFMERIVSDQPPQPCLLQMASVPLVPGGNSSRADVTCFLPPWALLMFVACFLLS